MHREISNEKIEQRIVGKQWSADHDNNETFVGNITDLDDLNFEEEGIVSIILEDVVHGNSAVMALDMVILFHHGPS